jgi:hypothetical protein
MNRLWKQRLEQGQALIEYVVMFPAGVLIAIMGLTVMGFLNSAYMQTYRGLECGITGSPSEEAPDPGNIMAQMFNHRIDFVSEVYVESNDTTTYTYRVTSGDSPAISHWTLGIPLSLQSRLIGIHENRGGSLVTPHWSWVNPDPTTGAVGIKFDDGYGEARAALPKLDDKTFARAWSGLYPLAAVEDAPVEVRFIIITLRGEFEIENLTATTKAGRDQVGTGFITGPIRLVDEDEASDLGSCGS